MKVSVRSLEGVVLAVLLLISSACAGAGSVGASGASEIDRISNASREAAARSSIILAVTNRGFADVVVYLVEGGVTARVGRIAAVQRAEILVLRASTLATPVRVLLRTAGSNLEYSPDPVLAAAGQVVELTIQPLLTTSQLTLR